METRFTDATGIVIHKMEGYNITLKKNVKLWGHFDTSDGGFSHIGPWYKTKAEILADHESFLIRTGMLNA